MKLNLYSLILTPFVLNGYCHNDAAINFATTKAGELVFFSRKIQSGSGWPVFRNIWK